MITSRPKTGCSLHELYLQEFNLRTKRVEVCGFNQESVKAFVHNEFPKSSNAEEVLNKLKESSTMEAMASIPIYLWVSCVAYTMKIRPLNHQP